VTVGLVECIVIGYLFSEELRSHVNATSEISVGRWWSILIKIVAPIVLGTILVTTIIEEIKTPYMEYPSWSLSIGALVAGLAVIMAFVFMKFKVKTKK
jgi:NSS family neurotransmitter:Na+ symporter